jgi:hypothetical protein
MVGPLRYFMVTWLSFGVLDTVVESASTTVLTVTPICRVVGGDDMTGCGRDATVKTYHIAVSIIAQLPGHRVAKGRGRREHVLTGFVRRLGTGRGRREHVLRDAACDIGSVRAIDRGFKSNVVSL